MAVTYNDGIDFDDGIRLVSINGGAVLASINSRDATFPSRFTAFMNWFQEAGEALEKEDPTKRPADKPISLNDWQPWLEKRVALCEEACKQMDSMFGEGMCKKAFPCGVPDESTIMELLDGLIPYINRAFEERGERIAVKYDKKRKGGRTQRGKAELIADHKARNAAGELLNGGGEQI